jgi:hypothetical protein
MSDTVACLIGFLFYLGFLYFFTILWTQSNLNGDSVLKIASSAFDLYKNGQPVFALLLFSLAIFRGIFGAGLVTLGCAGFAALAAICGLSKEILATIRQMLLDLYDFLRSMKSQPPVKV